MPPDCLPRFDQGEGGGDLAFDLLLGEDGEGLGGELLDPRGPALGEVDQGELDGTLAGLEGDPAIEGPKPGLSEQALGGPEVAAGRLLAGELGLDSTVRPVRCGLEIA